MAEYGISYMGSKQGICDEIIKLFPKAKNFYDLFGGGFSITHAMLLRRPRHYQNFHFNEIAPGICGLIKSAIAGEFSYEKFKPKFVARREYFKKKDTSAYIRCVWSFGNNQKDYIFSKEIEPYKKSMHNAIVFNEFDDLSREVLGLNKFADGFSIKDKRLFLRNKTDFYRKNGVPEALKKFISKDELGRLEQLEQLERLQQLVRLEPSEDRIMFYSESYEKVPIEKDSVIYCDPPYNGTAEYNHKIDFEKFYDWCDSQENPVFISEYNISDSRFKLLKVIKKRSLLSSQSRETKKEKVYVNRAGQEALNLK